MPKPYSKSFYQTLRRAMLLGAAVAALGVSVETAPSYAAQFFDAPIGLSLQPQGQGNAAAHIETSLNQSLDDAGEQDAQRTAVRAFYQARAHVPYWMNERGLYQRAELLISELEQAWTHGLNPESYYINQIESLRTRTGRMHKAELELLLTDAYLKYGRDLSGMRFAPEEVKAGPGNWRKPRSYDDLLERLQNQNDPQAIFASLVPDSRTYDKLRNALMRLDAAAGRYAQSFKPVHFDRLLRPGYAHNNVPDLRMRLGVPAPKGNVYLYDDALAAAVMDFQKAEYLKPDGVIGAQTLAALNRSPETQRQQLIVNLERLRWVDKPQAKRYVIVNIPSATLWAIKDGQVDLQMPVIVGKRGRPTMSFTTEIRGARINPNWTIPTTIKREDIWPQLKKDPSVIIGKGIEIYDGYNRDAPTVDPMKIKWNELTWSEMRKYRMVQSPGNNNPLGRFRVLMPNDYNIYLHDTNHPELFTTHSRDLSSGCVRMYDPVAMTDFILSQDPEWSVEKRNEILQTMKKTDIYIDEPIPVYLLYYTAWLDNKGDIIYGEDVYGWDKALLQAMQAKDGILLSNNSDKYKSNTSGRL